MFVTTLINTTRGTLFSPLILPESFRFLAAKQERSGTFTVSGKMAKEVLQSAKIVISGYMVVISNYISASCKGLKEPDRSS